MDRVIPSMERREFEATPTTTRERKERSSAKRVSRVVVGQKVVRQVEEEEEIVRERVRVKRREKPSPAMVTSTPKTGLNPLLQQGSPRLLVWEGSDWISSPRTGYTYTKSLTYRDRVTPGRETPMPHMARLPLYSWRGVAGLEHTELWELSEIELRRGRQERLDTLEEYSEDEEGLMSPHLIYRRKLVRRTLTNTLTSLFTHLLLPLTLCLATIRTASSWLLTSTHQLGIHLWSSLPALPSLPSLTSLTSTSRDLTESDLSPRPPEEDLLTEDETEEGGLDEFLSQQKIQYANVKETPVLNEVTTESWVTKLYSVIRSLLFVETISSVLLRLLSRKTAEAPRKRIPKRVIFTGVPEMPQTGAIDPYVSEEREVNVQVVADNEELHLNLSSDAPQPSGESRLSRAGGVGNMLISGLLYPFIFLQSIASASAAEISSAWEEIQEEEQEQEQEELTEKEMQEEVTEKEVIEKESSRKVRSKKKVKKQTFSQWFWSFFYRKKAVRRSRRLQGLDPEQAALVEKKRERRVRGKDLSDVMQTSADISEYEKSVELEEEEEEELIFLTYLQSLRVWLSGLLEWQSWQNVPAGEITPVSPEQDSADEGEKKKSVGAKTGLWVSVSTYLTSLLYKKQTRRSRRLKGLEPENTGFEPLRRSRRLRTGDSSTEENISGQVEEESDDLISEEYYELLVLVWLRSIFAFLKTNLLRKTEELSVKNNEANTSNIPQTSLKPVATMSVMSRLKQLFYSLLFKKR